MTIKQDALILSQLEEVSNGQHYGPRIWQSAYWPIPLCNPSYLLAPLANPISSTRLLRNGRTIYDELEW